MRGSRDFFCAGNMAVRLVIGVASLPFRVPNELEILFEREKESEGSMRAVESVRSISTTFAILFARLPVLKAQTKEIPLEKQVLYRSVKIDGLSIFYPLNVVGSI
jgi:hypothetical protein